jgi:hypothetical protein
MAYDYNGLLLRQNYDASYSCVLFSTNNDDDNNVAYRDPLLGNDRETKNKTTPAARQKILNKQIYAAVTE